MSIDTTAPLLRMVWPDEATELDLEPLQGRWTAEQYLLLTDQTNRLVEFSDGVIEVLPMPTDTHQRILGYLYRHLFALMEVLGGIVRFAPLRVQVRSGKYREPDLLLLLDANDPRRQDAFWLGADLVIEIVSPDKPKRDTEEKPRDYAEAQIPEYWIVNPLDDTITVLTLQGDTYATHGVFRRGDAASSRLLTDFTVDVAATFDAR